MSSLTSESPTTTPQAAAPDGSNDLRNYRVTLNFDPSLTGRLGPITLELLLGPNGSPGALAKLTQFGCADGGLQHIRLNNGASGNPMEGFMLPCWPESGAPQVLAAVLPTTKQVTFALALQAKCTRDDLFAVAIYCGGRPMPTTGPAFTGRVVEVCWKTGGPFVPAGYVGNGQINGVSVAGFSGSVTG